MPPAMPHQPATIRIALYLRSATESVDMAAQERRLQREPLFAALIHQFSTLAAS